MRIYEVDAARAESGCETCSFEIDIVVRGLRREGIGYSRCYEGLAHVINRSRRVRAQGVKEQIGGAEERRLPVELEVILALQNVVEHSNSAAYAHLAVAFRVPSKTEPRCEIVSVGEVRSHRRIFIPRENQPKRGLMEDSGLLTQD